VYQESILRRNLFWYLDSASFIKLEVIKLVVQGRQLHFTPGFVREICLDDCGHYFSSVICHQLSAYAFISSWRQNAPQAEEDMGAAMRSYASSEAG